MGNCRWLGSAPGRKAAGSSGKRGDRGLRGGRRGEPVRRGGGAAALRIINELFNMLEGLNRLGGDGVQAAAVIWEETSYSILSALYAKTTNAACRACFFSSHCTWRRHSSISAWRRKNFCGNGSSAAMKAKEPTPTTCLVFNFNETQSWQTHKP